MHRDVGIMQVCDWGGMENGKVLYRSCQKENPQAKAFLHTAEFTARQCPAVNVLQLPEFFHSPQQDNDQCYSKALVVKIISNCVSLPAASLTLPLISYSTS